ncbi:hybrid sensor histidine kinase/response regulator [Geitlerinema sp. P-1104]|uniref:sensor histidine kinase n=1 Tax=Geitlerinema sp. P-1104 TaxID=2546230 RepID=UPI00147776D5|nr:ATP-binding protein [Geitlerinema sp. P-1104]NMG59254.1 hybrid sensor histidine kinase/response regulator [Geitlerinema sp. P-1104]
MTLTQTFHLPPGVLTPPDLEVGDEGKLFLRSLGVELSYIQERTGRYRSFLWRNGANQFPTGHQDQVFEPVDTVAYLSHICRILDNRTPESINCFFKVGSDIRTFELSIAPLSTPSGESDCVLVLGRQAGTIGTTQSATSSSLQSASLEFPLTNRPDSSSFLTQVSYPKLLTQISRQIRQTLDLDIIWQQTAQGLGAAMKVAQCSVYSYEGHQPQVRRVAQFPQDSPSLGIGAEALLQDFPELQQAITTLEPTLVDRPVESQVNRSQVLVATRHQGQVNGIISLERERPEADSSIPVWHPTELEIITELADQVGTAIAHATLYRELEIARQEAEEVSRLKSDFLANTSHELRTPLNGMMGFLKLILDGMTDDSEEQMEFIEEAYRSAVHLLSIINDILDIAKIEAGKMHLDLEPVNIKELLTHVEEFVQAQIQQKQLYFQVQMPDTEDSIIVYGNYQRLLQILLNLVGNAIKFTHEGGITITAEIISRPVVVHDREFSGLLKLKVADTGIGVSLEQQDKLFQTFSQVDGSRTRQYGGTGLGLVISQKLVEAMGGEVHFYSMGEGLGSTVTFTIALFQEPVMISLDENLDSLDLLVES